MGEGGQFEGATWQEAEYIKLHKMSLEKKEPATAPVLKHRRIDRKPVVHPSEREARTREEKAAAEKVRAANKTDLKKRNIK